MVRIPDDLPVGAPDWIVTFSDMVSLLVTFFILLMTFSSLDSFESFQVVGSLGGTPGILVNSGGPSAPDPPQADLMAAIRVERGSTTPHTRPPDGLPDDLEEMGQRLDEEHLEVDLSQVADGLLVHFDPRGAFLPGSAQVQPHLAKALTELGRTLQYYPHLVVVEGHTDGGFEPSPAYPDAEDLALTRAHAAAALMIAQSQLPATLVQIAGLGSSAPLEDNATALGRTANRRVEVRILSLSRTRYADLVGAPR